MENQKPKVGVGVMILKDGNKMFNFSTNRKITISTMNGEKILKSVDRMELDLFKRRKAIRNDYYEELESFVKTAKPEWIINNKDEFDAKVLEFLTLKGTS